MRSFESMACISPPPKHSNMLQAKSYVLTVTIIQLYSISIRWKEHYQRHIISLSITISSGQNKWLSLFRHLPFCIFLWWFWVSLCIVWSFCDRLSTSCTRPHIAFTSAAWNQRLMLQMLSSYVELNFHTLESFNCDCVACYMVAFWNTISILKGYYESCLNLLSLCWSLPDCSHIWTAIYHFRTATKKFLVHGLHWSAPFL